jgi:hypothetical protein
MLGGINNSIKDAYEYFDVIEFVWWEIVFQ